MHRLLALLISALLLTALAGCHTPSCGPVESALRQTEEHLRETREQLHRQGVYTAALEHEMRIIRGDVYNGQPGKPVAIFPVRSVVLGRQTGGHDSPSGQCDDGLQVIIEPQNAEGRPIQVPGEAMLQVLEVSTEGHKRLLSTWYIDKDQIKASWRMGLLSQGYNLILPWKVIPSTEKLRLMLQFRLEDGRLFEADRDVTVRRPRGAPLPQSIPVVTAGPQSVLPAPKDSATPPTPAAPTDQTPLVPPPASIPGPGSGTPTLPTPTPFPEPTPPTPQGPTLDGPSLTPVPGPESLVKPAAALLGRPR